MRPPIPRPTPSADAAPSTVETVASPPPAAAPEPAPPTAPAQPAEDTADGEAEGVHREGAEHLREILPAVSRATALVQAFRDHGHQLARIDPLGTEPPGHPQLSPAFHGTSMEELGRLPASLVVDEAEEGRSVADAFRRTRPESVTLRGRPMG